MQLPITHTHTHKLAHTENIYYIPVQCIPKLHNACIHTKHCIYMCVAVLYIPNQTHGTTHSHTHIHIQTYIRVLYCNISAPKGITTVPFPLMWELTLFLAADMMVEWHSGVRIIWNELALAQSVNMGPHLVMSSAYSALKEVIVIWRIGGLPIPPNYAEK